jgi:hypothetical protein
VPVCRALPIPAPASGFVFGCSYHAQAVLGYEEGLESCYGDKAANIESN